LASVIEGAVCNINTDIRQSQSAPDERICCHEDSIKVADTFCTEFASESYKCVTKSKCHSEPHRREAALTSICSRTGHHQAAIEVSKENDRVCCHQDDIEEVILKEELCSDYTSEGYKCIDQSKCVAIDPRQAGITKPEAICPSSSVRQTGDASETKICCHQADIKKSCSEYAAAGFR
jgi:hypothetical protein